MISDHQLAISENCSFLTDVFLQLIADHKFSQVVASRGKF